MIWVGQNDRLNVEAIKTSSKALPRNTCADNLHGWPFQSLTAPIAWGLGKQEFPFAPPALPLLNSKSGGS